jgi:hypothetical protein
MAAASTDLRVMRGAQHAVGKSGVLAACAAGAASAACVLVASGCAALSMQAGLGQQASAWWMSALALATMMGAPLLIARSSSRYTKLKTAATLIAAMSAMSAVPGYLNGLPHGHAVAVTMMVAGGILLLFGLRSSPGRPAFNAHHPVDMSVAAVRLNGATVMPALLALFAGLSSGSLARFQLFALCGASGAQPLWQIALLFTAVCALACMADRSRNNSNGMLMMLYLVRAGLIAALATADKPALAPFAAKIFLLLDCLTIPALANLRGNSTTALSVTCPGILHHIGMVTGAALSTSRYFFGDAFVVLFALSAAANLLCAASLATLWRGRQPASATRESLPPLSAFIQSSNASLTHTPESMH